MFLTREKFTPQNGACFKIVPPPPPKPPPLPEVINDRSLRANSCSYVWLHFPGFAPGLRWSRLPFLEARVKLRQTRHGQHGLKTATYGQVKRRQTDTVKVVWSCSSDEVKHKLNNSKISIHSDMASSSIRDTNTFVE